MNFLNNLHIKKFHESKIGKYGAGNEKTLGWFSKESQVKRFEVLCQAGNMNNASVLDIGCGNGDLCAYLSEHYTGFTYSGIDLMAAFLDHAIELNKDCASARFYLGDFMSASLPPADYVLACGSLNYKNSDPRFIYRAISRLYGTCNAALAFNLLSKTINPEGILCAYPPAAIVSYCRTLSDKVVLNNDYEDGDFTVMMYKPVKT